MLTIIAKRRVAKTKLRAKQLVSEGLKKVVTKLYKQAMLCFGEAIELDQETVLPLLKEQFIKFYRLSDYDSALSCGMAAFKVCKTDPDLTNQLGNCARRHDNYKQANNMYRFALKIDRNHKDAFLNLAASMGKVDLYDRDVGIKIKQHLDLDEFIYPEYLENPQFIEQVVEALIQDFEEHTAFQEENQQDGDIYASESISAPSTQYARKKKKEKAKKYQPTVQDIIDYIKKEQADCSENGLTPDPIYYQKLQYNLGIYCLVSNQLNEAQNCFKALSKTSANYEYIEMLSAVTQYKMGHAKDAIEVFIKLLGKDRYNRFYNANLGMIYKKEKNRLLATKYLAVAAFLLDKSDGVYKTSDIMRLAHQAFEEGDLKKAYRLYSIITSESDNIEAILKIGDIFFSKKNFRRAADQYFHAIKVDPDHPEANERIESSFQFFYTEAHQMYRKNKFVNAVDGYEKALIFKTEISALKAVFDIYTHLKRIDKAKVYEEKYLKLLAEENEKQLKKEKADLIKKGKIYLKSKSYHEAIKAFEEAFSKVPDKDIFMYLAHLYKSLRRKAELEHLLTRWHQIREEEERIKIEKSIEEKRKKAESLFP